MESVSYSTQLDKLKVVNNTSIFAGIGIHEQNLLVDKLFVIHRNADEIIIEQGEIGDSLYIILKGRVHVLVKHEYKGWLRINTLGPGDVFGEIAILRNIPRTARITTETPCTLLTINAKDFLDIYQYFPAKSRDNIQLFVAKRLAAHPSHRSRLS